MGAYKRTQPKELKHKLKTIRERLNLTQEEMIAALQKHAAHEFLDTGYISRFESGKREPSLPVLLAYSKLAGVTVNVLIDDKLELPKRLRGR
jgi:transcriptional regulator with XRE-family HTH domain